MSEDAKIKITIDGISTEVAPGTTILNAARMIGGDVVPPAMCYYSSLKEAEVNAAPAWLKSVREVKKTHDRCPNW